MTTLSPTPSRGRRFPVSAIVLVAILIGALLIGAGLLLTGGGGDDDASSPTPTASCSFSAEPPSGTVTINVYNATERAGLAGETAETLEQRDFEIDEVANDPEKQTVDGTALVRYVGKNAAKARWVAAQVPDATVTKVSADDRANFTKIDLVIGEDFDALASTEAAKTAFAKAAADAECGTASAPTP